jgi:hypothetical protein
VPEAPADTVSDELLYLLDHEVKHLPDKYRAPVIFCDLQGRSRLEAARELGWPIGTLNWRLAQARTILTKRLARHGAPLTAGALAMTLSRHASASVPTLLITQTVKMGTTLAANEALTAGLLSVKVASLAEGVVKAMFLAKLRLGAMVLAATALLGTGAGLFSYCAPWATAQAGHRQNEAQPLLADEPAADQEASRFRTANFWVDAPTPEIARKIGEAAEANLKSLSRLWHGKELPQWPELCPIRVKLTGGDSHSATSFTFAKGNVTGRHVTLDGPLDYLVKVDLPHEIAHVILAHHFSCPVPRWADEGVAILSAEGEFEIYEKAQLEVLSKPGRFIPLCRLFGLHDFPADVTALRAEGYSLTRFLLQQKSPHAFLEFVSQGMRDGWNKASKDQYGYLDIAHMESAWLKEVTKATEGPVYIDQHGKTHPYYTLAWKLAWRGNDGNKEQVFPRLTFADEGHEKLFNKESISWGGATAKDPRGASTTLEVAVTDRPRGKVLLELACHDNDVKKAAKDDTLIVGRNVSMNREIEPGKEYRLVLSEDDEGQPKRWIQFTLSKTSTQDISSLRPPLTK